jgi:O-antigen ligase
MKLPFLAVPLAFYNLPPVKERQYHLLHYVFFILMFSAAIPPLLNYGLNYYKFQEAIGQGKSISLPVQHVKFSLFYAFGIISMIILYRKGFVYKWRIERKLQIGAIVLGILFLHVLAIRTGILVFYVGLFLLAITDVVKKGKWKTIIAVLIMSFIIPVASYYAVPSFHKKVDYMLWDYGKFSQGEGKGYSDSERIESIKIGLQLVKEHPISGTGIGDLKDETKTRYLENFGPEKYVLYPHNQYLFVTAGMGLVGLLVFLFCLGFPYFYFRINLHPLFLSLGIITFVAFFVDNLLERSVGVGFYVFFLCLGISLLHKSSKHNA